MPHPDTTPLDRPRELLALRRRVTEELGLGPSDPIVRDLDRLGRCWNDALYGRVTRVLLKLQLAREAMDRQSERTPFPGAFEGPVLIGAFSTPSGTYHPVTMESARLTLHTLVCGLPGMGKTWAVRLLLQLIVRSCPNVRVLVFDPNRSYKDFCSDPGFWLSIPWQDVRLNPFVPPDGYPLELWMAEKVDLLTRGELMNSKYLLANRLDGLFEEARRHVGLAAAFRWPSLYDLRDNLAARRCRPGSREEQYRESALNVLDGRIRTSGLVYDCSEGMEPLLANTRGRISTEGLSPLASLDAFVTNLIHYAYRRRCTEPHLEPAALHTLIVIEEAQTLLERRADAPLALYQEILLRSRGAGMGFVFVTQDISRIDPTVLAACSNYMAFAQSSADNKRAAQRVLDLSPHETDLLGRLQVGECFLRFTGHPRWSYPFAARIPPYDSL